MRVDIIVMVSETLESIMNWQLKPEVGGQLRAIRNDKSIQMPIETWEELTDEIKRRNQNGRQPSVEIFLYLRDGLRGSIEEYGVLKEIVADARSHALAGRLYVVWDDRALETSFYELDALNMLVKCFQGLLQERVTDIIEITHKDVSEIASKVKSLGELGLKDQKRIIRGRAVSSQARRKKLDGLVSKKRWSYALRNESRLLENLLNEFVKDGYLPPSSPNRLIIFDASPTFGPEELLDEFVKGHQRGKRVVATTFETYSAILRYNREAGLRPLDVIAFKGTLEIVYALLLLNDAGKSPTSRTGSNAGVKVGQAIIKPAAPVKIKSIKLNRRPLFSIIDVQSTPRLLITSAFGREDMSHSKSEEREIGALLGKLAPLARVDIKRFIDCEKSLPSLLKFDQFTAWIHLGHGDEDGMYDSGQKMTLAPWRWLNCFKNYGGRGLKLALFSVCKSARTAGFFARAGVGVAIGFKNDAHTDATIILAETVVPAAMQIGSDQEMILKAFREGCQDLASRTFNEGVRYIEVEPIAFRSIRK